MSPFQEFGSPPSPDLMTEWLSPPAEACDLTLRGSHYLAMLRRISPDLPLIDLEGDCPERLQMCHWIGHHIHRLNIHLRGLLQECHRCFYASEQPQIQIWAAPLAPPLQLDGFCYLAAQPTALLIDVGHIFPEDWLGVVAHEYAHALVGSPGHDVQFHQKLTHLCLGLGLLPPPLISGKADLERWPPYRATTNSTALWLGKGPLPARLE